MRAGTRLDDSEGWRLSKGCWDLPVQPICYYGPTKQTSLPKRLTHQVNVMHESNRRYWNEAAEWWERLEEEGGLWQRCPSEPALAFAGGALGLVREAVGAMAGKDVCVIGSGDNHAVFAFSGMGAKCHVGRHL